MRMSCNRTMKNNPLVVLLKKLNTRRAPLVITKEDGSNKFKNLLSLNFLRGYGTQERRRKEAHLALSSKGQSCKLHHPIPPSKNKPKPLSCHWAIHPLSFAQPKTTLDCAFHSREKNLLGFSWQTCMGFFNNSGFYLVKRERSSYAIRQLRPSIGIRNSSIYTNGSVFILYSILPLTHSFPFELMRANFQEARTFSANREQSSELLIGIRDLVNKPSPLVLILLLSLLWPVAIDLFHFFGYSQIGREIQFDHFLSGNK